MEINYADHILTVDGIIPNDLCKDIIDHFEGLRENGFGSNGNSLLRGDEQLAIQDLPLEMLFYNQKLSKRYLDIFWESIYPIYAEHNPILNNVNKHSIFALKVQKTPVSGGFHNWHCELNGDKGYSNRLLVLMTYLNDVDEGGETEFLTQSVRVQPKTGRTVVWPAHFTHPHRGNPPLKDTKYIITGWVEFN